MIVGGFSLAGSILGISGYSKLENWANKMSALYPLNFEFRELSSAFRVIKAGLIMRTVSPILNIAYIGVFIYIAGWIVFLVGLGKFFNQIKSISCTQKIHIPSQPTPVYPHSTPESRNYSQNFRYPTVYDSQIPSQNQTPNGSRVLSRNQPQSIIKAPPMHFENRYCPNCGENLPAYAKFCTYCGQNLNR